MIGFLPIMYLTSLLIYEVICVELFPSFWVVTFGVFITFIIQYAFVIPSDKQCCHSLHKFKRYIKLNFLTTTGDM